jgi:hypothetical protein
MKDNSYTTSIEVTRTPDHVFNCITAGVKKWWGGEDLEGGSAKLNDEFIIHHPGAHYSKQKVVEFVPGKKLVWLVTDGTLHWLKVNQHEWTGTKLIFEIIPSGTGARLQFAHDGLVPELECYERVSQGWDTVIKEWLFEFINTGTPHFK